MGPIIALIIVTVILAAFIGYYLTKEQPQKEESPLQKVLNKSLERSANEKQKKVEVKKVATKATVTAELKQLINESDELAKEVHKIPVEDLVAYTATLQEAKPESTAKVPHKRKTRHAYKK